MLDEGGIAGRDIAFGGDAAGEHLFPGLTGIGRDLVIAGGAGRREDIGHVLAGLLAQLSQFIILQPVAISLHLDRALDILGVGFQHRQHLVIFGLGLGCRGILLRRQALLQRREQLFRLVDILLPSFAQEIHHLPAQGHHIAIDLLRGDGAIGHVSEAAEARFRCRQREIAETDHGHQDAEHDDEAKGDPAADTQAGQGGLQHGKPRLLSFLGNRGAALMPSRFSYANSGGIFSRKV